MGATGFAGWPREALAFLRELEEHNEREWFHANRPRYDAHVAGPAKALGAALADLGDPHVFRPFNDTRFHPGPPIKEHVGLVVGRGVGGGIFYVELSLDGVLVAAGIHAPAPDQVDRLRHAVADGRRAAGLTRALRRAEGAGLERSEPDLKRTPRGWPADHPRAELLRHRRLVVARRHELGPWLHGDEALARVRADLDAAAPLVRWLREHVGPSTKPRR
ncbi:DUF2461 domain-containing protein [Conexibacter sp. SYSU D00693]|uniref:DUF2461 domain-containing protein n=1 Tax=Conexibacter sp. SYSU D00693 TaxID=2812560 RepID=UPI00196B7537|nr:DUF2461 domain-containing protein [Conexibacter sp. SYSU D00693]